MGRLPQRLTQFVLSLCCLCLPFSLWAAQTGVELLLQTSALAGLRYYAGKAVWPELHEGDALNLVREPDNVYDPQAICVEWHTVKLGYVPRRENAALARLLDHGVTLRARIVRLIQRGKSSRRLLFEVYEPLG